MGELKATSLRGETSIAQLSPYPAKPNQRLFESVLQKRFAPRLREKSSKSSAHCRFAFELMSKASPQSNARPKFNYAPAALYYYVRDAARYARGIPYMTSTDLWDF